MELPKEQRNTGLPEENENPPDLPEGSAKSSDLPENRSKQAAKWHCDIYCRKIRHVTCEGREYADSSAAELCPYYDEMLY